MCKALQSFCKSASTSDKLTDLQRERYSVWIDKQEYSKSGNCTKVRDYYIQRGKVRNDVKIYKSQKVKHKSFFETRLKPIKNTIRLSHLFIS